MDTERFDNLARNFLAAASRRTALAGLMSGLLLEFSLPRGGDDVSAKKKRRKKKKTQSPTTPPPSCVSDCAGKACGDDGCGGTCGAACSGGKTCQNGSCACPDSTQECNGSCVAPCAAPSVRNPVTCGCCLATAQFCGQPGDAPCCTTNDPPCNTTCRGNPDGGPCQFTAQCNPGRQCLNGLCT